MLIALISLILLKCLMFILWFIDLNNIKINIQIPLEIIPEYSGIKTYYKNFIN